MDEDINSTNESSEKRRVDEDTINSKPNTKRIKLVRPVFSALSKPVVSTSYEAIKSSADSSESSNSYPSILKPEVESSKVSDIYPVVSNPERTTCSINSSTIEDQQNECNKEIPDLKVPFSENTIKQLEQIKKSIFKIEDDGSSSENDSQPKRPRLKRPTFGLTNNEKKETNDYINESNTEIDSKPTTDIENEELPFENNSIDCHKKEPSHLIEDININEISNYDCLKIKLNNEEVIEEIKSSESNIDSSYTINVLVNKDVESKILEKEIVDNDSIQKSNELIVNSSDMSEIQPNAPKKVAEIVDVIDKNNILLEASNNIVEKTVDYNLINIKEPENEVFDSEFTNASSDDKCITINDVEKISFEKSNNKTNLNYDDEKIVISTAIPKVEMNTSYISKSVIGVNLSIKTSPIKNENENDNYISLEKEQSDVEQNCEGSESQLPQLFKKSDILKAALTSKKILEPIQKVTQLNNQTSQQKLVSIDNIKDDSFPINTEDIIVNEIDTNIKVETSMNLISSQTLPEPKNCNTTTETTKSDEKSSLSNDETNITDLPKWGSEKMNEVEKFLNDSNVTITPISTQSETPKLNKITLKLPKVGNPEIKTENTNRPDVKSELLKKISSKQHAIVDSPLKSALSQPSKCFSDFATIVPAHSPSAEQIALLEQQILNTPKKRGRPSKALTQQKQLLLQYQQQQQQQPNLSEKNETDNENVFHVPLFDMDSMSSGNIYNPFEASTPKRGKSNRGRGRGRGRGGRTQGREQLDNDNQGSILQIKIEGNAFNDEMNQEEETKHVAMMEAERIRKEEERERKIEERKRKLKERNDAIKEKKLRKKQKAEERRLQWHEKKRLLQEEKARQAEMRKSLPPPLNFDDETRMSADINLSQTSARNFMIGDDDLSISGATNDSSRLKKGRMEVIDLESNKTLTVDQIAEYQWPLEGGELYMIQEQISNYLGVKSFKRKYPGLKRRNVEAEERSFLCDSGLVAESLCDLGLTVLYSSEVLDIMYVDFPEKYEELREYMRLKHAKELSNRHKALITFNTADGSKLDLRDRAMEAAANWNANLNKSRLESRKCTMDMQTFIVHYPKSKCKKMILSKQKIGHYPVALLPGQFCDYYATYSNEELRYLPINTVMYGPLKTVDKDFPISLSSQSESDDSSSEDSSDSDESVDTNKLGNDDLEIGPSDKKGAECKLCVTNPDKSSKEAEPLIHCSKCLSIYHPTCLEMSLEMIPHIKRYNWQCNDCKSCAQCKEAADEDKMLFCDLCDRGYHIYCVGLRKVPEGRWHCQECAMCSSCGANEPGPADSKWFYEFKKVEKSGIKMYSRTLCAPCSRLHRYK
ncbi:inner centromere protein A isoform X2 [Daktulosphaira vitifoliae]|uniref:inner centromere protein A isoform X2 n=1 Tax=Daktulosphaira vitifoliae TaxID=58002 RepID=UPI0021AB05E9|nr:inner centromere protein A isoform X2 [Daktulosphaira vitifoliae]